MDFSRPHVIQPSVASRSNIRYIPLPDREDDDGTELSLDDRVIDAANQAAEELLLGPTAGRNHHHHHPQKKTVEECTRLVDASRFTERMTPSSDTIQAGSLVVIFESFDNLDFVYATPKEIFNNRNGHFHHDDFIGKPFGCKIRSRNNRGYGFCYLLKPTPELWARSLNHRTQIVHELDASMICFYLQLKPNFVVCETGTGSGAMSHAILRTIAPFGKLHTFEFNHQRSVQARQEFAKNGLSHLVNVYHKDVCGKAPVIENYQPDKKDKDNEAKDNSDKKDNTVVQGGFGLPGQSVDAIFLDLPEPWLAVPHAAFCLKPNGRLASYSPCVEQTQRTVTAMRKAGFHSLKTLEFRNRENYVDEYDLEPPPKEKRPRPNESNATFLANSNDNTNSMDEENTTLPNHNQNNDNAAAARAAAMANMSGGEDTGAEADNEESQVSETEADQLSLTMPGGVEELEEAIDNNEKVTTTTTTTTTTGTDDGPITTMEINSKRYRAKAAETERAAVAGKNKLASSKSKAAAAKPTPVLGKREKRLVARPFVMMRGHTAFLTFATAGNLPQPDPNQSLAS